MSCCYDLFCNFWIFLVGWGLGCRMRAWERPILTDIVIYYHDEIAPIFF